MGLTGIATAAAESGIGSFPSLVLKMTKKPKLNSAPVWVFLPIGARPGELIHKGRKWSMVTVGRERRRRKILNQRVWPRRAAKRKRRRAQNRARRGCR